MEHTIAPVLCCCECKMPLNEAEADHRGCKLDYDTTDDWKEWCLDFSCRKIYGKDYSEEQAHELMEHEELIQKLERGEELTQAERTRLDALELARWGRVRAEQVLGGPLPPGAPVPVLSRTDGGGHNEVPCIFDMPLPPRSRPYVSIFSDSTKLDFNNTFNGSLVSDYNEYSPKDEWENTEEDIGREEAYIRYDEELSYRFYRGDVLTIAELAMGW